MKNLSVEKMKQINGGGWANCGWAAVIGVGLYLQPEFIGIYGSFFLMQAIQCA